MKYIKNFLNESNNIELIKFCNDNLAFLIDEGFRVLIDETPGYTYISIDRKDHNIFNWIDYKDDLIQFIRYLYEKYHYDERINIIDRHGSSNFIKIANN